MAVLTRMKMGSTTHSRSARSIPHWGERRSITDNEKATVSAARKRL
jgi:hypothetical protein